MVDDLAIGVVPLPIRFGAEEFVDRIDLTPPQFWARCKSSPTLPETAAPSPGAFEAEFRAAAEAGHDSVVCINLSGGLSATIQAAQIAAAEVADAITLTVADPPNVTIPLGLIAVDAPLTPH